jgi:ketosteroid isomerase-like protein
MRKALVATACLLALAACRGPKGSPDGTVKSFYAAAEAKDYEAMASTLTARARSQLGSAERAERAMASLFEGWTEIDLDIGETIIDASGQTATVHFACKGESVANYKVVKYDCSDILKLEKADDGKWYIIPPSSRSLRPM